MISHVNDIFIRACLEKMGIYWKYLLKFLVHAPLVQFRRYIVEEHYRHRADKIQISSMPSKAEFISFTERLVEFGPNKAGIRTQIAGWFGSCRHQSGTVEIPGLQREWHTNYTEILPTFRPAKGELRLWGEFFCKEQFPHTQCTSWAPVCAH